MDLSRLLFVGLVASAAVTTIGPKQDSATASLAGQVAPGAIVGTGTRPESTRRTSAPCNPAALGIQVNNFCSEGTSPECCEAVVAAVEDDTATPGDFPCICQLEDDTAFLLTGFGIGSIACIYVDDCGGLRPGVDRLVDVCHAHCKSTDQITYHKLSVITLTSIIFGLLELVSLLHIRTV